MTRTVKRTLSLVLALIMICSTLGVMAFAADELQECGRCGRTPTSYYTVFNSRSFDRITECPTHETHDAEVYIALYDRYCSKHDVYVGWETVTVYICLG